MAMCVMTYCDASQREHQKVGVITMIGGFDVCFVAYGVVSIIHKVTALSFVFRASSEWAVLHVAPYVVTLLSFEAQ